MIEVKVGQEVGYGKFHWDALLYGGASRVAKIDRYGRIELENGKRFDKNGHALPAKGETYANAAYLMTIEAYHATIAYQNARQLRNRLANEIVATVGEHRLIAMSDETRLKLQDMIARM